MILDNNTIVHDGYICGRYELVTIESRCCKYDVIGLPFAWWSRGINEGWRLFVDRPSLTISVGLILIIIKDLDLV